MGKYEAYSSSRQDKLIRNEELTVWELLEAQGDEKVKKNLESKGVHFPVYSENEEFCKSFCNELTEEETIGLLESDIVHPTTVMIGLEEPIGCCITLIKHMKDNLSKYLNYEGFLDNFLDPNTLLLNHKFHGQVTALQDYIDTFGDYMMWDVIASKLRNYTEHAQDDWDAEHRDTLDKYGRKTLNEFLVKYRDKLGSYLNYEDFGL